MKTLKTELSILIPIYNTVCVAFVKRLQWLAESAGIDYEIIVADDASPLQICKEQNRQIANLSHCRYIENENNIGAAANRNFLAQQSQYCWLLFLDCDMKLPNESFLSRYLATTSSQVINGGLRIGGDKKMLQSNLRYKYEKHEEPNHTAQQRQKHPYQSFRSTNFMISRDVMLQNPFDERFERSGYEDVLFGKQLRQNKVTIKHIDNPLLMTDYETNPDYVAKIERSLRTLYTFRYELHGYSRLLTLVEGIHVRAIRSLIIMFHRTFGPMERWNLCGSHPSLTIFKLYRLGYYLSIKH